MNIDLIIKLAKLANNNPNDHEANSAARRVCKLLAEGNFAFGIVRTTTPDFKSTRDPYTGNRDPVHDIYDLYEELGRKRRETYQRTAEQYRQGDWTTPEFKQCPRCLRNALVDNPINRTYYCSNCHKEISYVEFHSKKRTSSHRCIHCRKKMTEPAEIANKICGDCWRKEREKFGL